MQISRILFLIDVLLQPGLAQVNPYQGRTVTTISGTTARSADDTYATDLGKCLPEDPIMVVHNMAGGGSLIAAKYTYGLAKPGGLTITSQGIK